MACIFDVEGEVAMSDIKATYVGPIKCTCQLVLAVHL